MTEKFLDKVYGSADETQIKALYDDWAQTYDAEIADNGYATPGRCAAALWSKMPEPDAPILDYGCGTGLSGLALKLAGYKVIDGMDPSPEMLKLSEEKQVYRAAHVLDLDDPGPIPRGKYKGIAAIGVIGTGAAPPETLDLLMNAMRRGDMLVFSFNDHALGEPEYEGRLNQWLDCGAARLLVKEYGDHLPGQDLKSNVYVVEKA